MSNHNQLTQSVVKQLPNGLYISCDTPVGVKGNPGLSAHVSAEIGRDVRAATSLWVVKGVGHAAVGNFITGIANHVVASNLDEFEGYGFVPIMGDSNNEPATFMPMVSVQEPHQNYDELRQDRIDATALRIAMGANALFEVGMSPIRLPLPNPEQQ